MTGWFRRSSKPTKWIKKKAFHGFGFCWRWKETAPWTRKYLLCIYLESENVNIENDLRIENYSTFLNLAFQKGERDREWTELPEKNKSPLWNQKYFELLQKTQNSEILTPPSNHSRRCTLWISTDTLHKTWTRMLPGQS